MNQKASRLRKARIDAGFADGTEAANALGIPVPTYNSHENGTRGFRADSAARYARRFGVSAEWLLYGKGEPAKDTTKGFSDGEAEPFDLSTRKTLIEKDFSKSTTAAVLAPNGASGFGMRAGSILIYDPQRNPKTGDYVVVTRDDRDLGYSSTHIRRLIGEYLVRPDGGDPELIDDTITIRGKITQMITDF